MKNTQEILNLVPITVMNDYEWEEYYLFSDSQKGRNVNPEEIQKFKKRDWNKIQIYPTG